MESEYTEFYWPSPKLFKLSTLKGTLLSPTLTAKLLASPKSARLRQRAKSVDPELLNPNHHDNNDEVGVYLKELEDQLTEIKQMSGYEETE